MSLEQSSGYDPPVSILLYPEWDEFYLLVCDICGMIIMPQALEKHLARKHRIGKVNGNDTENKSDGPNNNSSNSCCSPSDGSSSNSALGPPPASIVNETQPPESIVNGTLAPTPPSNVVDPIFYDLEPPSPSITTTSKSSSSTASSMSSASSSNLSLNHPAIRSSPSHSITSRYQQDRKWRNTYNVLRDTFF